MIRVQGYNSADEAEQRGCAQPSPGNAGGCPRTADSASLPTTSLAPSLPPSTEAARPQLEEALEEEELLPPLAGNTTHDLAPAGEGVHGVVARPGPPKPSPAAQAANFVQSTVGHVMQEAGE